MLRIKNLVTFCAASILLSTGAMAAPLTCDESPYSGLFGTCREILQKSVDTVHQFEAEIAALEKKRANVCRTKSNKKKQCKAVKQQIKSLKGMQAFIGNALPNQMVICSCPEVTNTL